MNNGTAAGLHHATLYVTAVPNERNHACVRVVAELMGELASRSATATAIEIHIAGCPR
ncbi:expressed unknown protein [Ectocarpus siliculosus]|uniref:Uncharacterized protein n=1 Tax=Ectocarpus siliculosus TaxID=2880 RepID=D8LR90_ECTSI|nr:expressed unknown protein [Ectocarpus siliculosus]|eukprot:CBN74995.1 expressed unknown protein [Ectocarpus siliculosus]